MARHALTSSSFVINAMYTYTFGNTLFLMSVKEGTQSFAYKDVQLSAPRILCGVMMLIMTLRYFFGNNSFMTKVMDEVNNKGPWVRLYQFSSILAESLLLLATSYLVPYSTRFVYGFTALMAVEVLWYFCTRVVDRDSVVLADPVANRAFFFAEMTNAGFVAGVALLTAVSCTRGVAWLSGVLVLFLANTAYDAYINMPSYMS